MMVVNKTKKIYYSMGEVCEMFDLPASTIRFWEKNFSIIKPSKNAKGNRLFTPDDVETLKVIYHLVKEKGMTLSGAQRYIKDNRMAARSESDVVEALLQIREALVDIRNEITVFEKNLDNEILIPTEVTLDNEQEEELVHPSKYIEPMLFDFSE